MNYERIDCIDAGTEYCPCHLAETGDCILCSQLSGKTFCHCMNWKGVCIYQEYVWNGKKAKEGRKTYECRIISKKTIDDLSIIYKIKAPHDLVKYLIQPGSFIFMRNPKTDELFDVPISVMDADESNCEIIVAIEIVGVKTKKIGELNIDDYVSVKGPYWNGVLGIKSLLKQENNNILVIINGIGQAPVVPVLKQLYRKGNRIITIIDKGEYSDIFIRDYLNKYSHQCYEMGIFNKGELSDTFKLLLLELIEKEKIQLIHCASQDIIIKKVSDIIGDSIYMSCCNNVKMCCGEGVCGACTIRYKGHVVKRFCKLQTDPGSLFEGRRLI